eukprot:GILK01011788.1.p1 GENE.GILK01011788.1~~GILK01011788.1.p1  ORF type:complete len:977 (-),score=171.66 GILK01011788.1:53-2941(-)
MGKVKQPPRVKVENAASTSTSAAAPAGTTTTTSSSKRADEKIKFSLFCKLLDNLAAKKTTEKMNILGKFFELTYKSDDVYPVMRLLLPHLDRERQVYGLKEMTIARFYSDLLGLPENEANRLKHWKDPTKQLQAGSKVSAGDFVNVLYDVLSHSRCRPDPILYLSDINRYLDQLSGAVDNDEKKKVLANMLRETTADEQKWIVRIILKDLKIGLRHETLLKHYHQDAIDLYNATSDLKQVFEELRDPARAVGGAAFKLFQPIKPMLASKKHYKDIAKVMGGHKYAIETKFDGERIQVHMRGDEIKMFTRNSNDYTPHYGPQMRDILRKQIKLSACILDGEMLAWDTRDEVYLPFGNNKTVALASAEENDGKQLCYLVFDILYLETPAGDPITTMENSLADRREILRKAIDQVPHRLEVVPYKETESVNLIMQELGDAIQRREEGLIIKRLDSQYLPNDRSNLWIKLKPDYTDSLGDNFDLLIIGGYFGEGKRRTQGGGDWTDHISHFLLGVAENTAGGRKPEIFYPFCKVGTGYSVEELRDLRQKLKPYWARYDASNPPAFMRGWIPAAGERPNVYIKPHQSVMLEVKAAEVTTSESFLAGYTLRFPRVQRIRYDKDWFECMDQAGLQESVTQYRKGLINKNKRVQEQLLAEEEDQDGEGTTRRKKRKVITRVKRGTGGVMMQFRDTDTSHVERKSKLFSSMEMCILNTDERKYPKQELETLIVQYGGSKVQNVREATTHILAARLDMKVRNQIQVGERDILHYQWLLECIAQKQVVPLEPKYMIHATRATKDKFSRELDRYGDHYTRQLTLNGLQDLLKEVGKQEQQRTIAGQDDEDTGLALNHSLHRIWNSLDERVKRQLACKSIMFRPCVMYVDRFQVVGDSTCPIPYSPLEIVSLKIRLYGGRIVETIEDGVTHVVVAEETDDMRREHLRSCFPSASLVPPSFIDLSVHTGRLLNASA